MFCNLATLERGPHPGCRPCRACTGEAKLGHRVQRRIGACLVHREEVHQVEMAFLVTIQKIKIGSAIIGARFQRDAVTPVIIPRCISTGRRNRRRSS